MSYDYRTDGIIAKVDKLEQRVEALEYRLALQSILKSLDGGSLTLTEAAEALSKMRPNPTYTPANVDEALGPWLDNSPWADPITEYLKDEHPRLGDHIG